MGLIRESILKFTKNEDMNENKIIDRKFFADLAEEYALNTSHFEWLGGVRHPEIVVKGDMLDRLIELQSQFKRLEVMGDIQPDGNTLVSCRFHIHGAKSNPVYRPEIYPFRCFKLLFVCYG